MTPLPSPALMQATAKALGIFAAAFPRSIAISGAMYRDGQSRDELIRTWASNLIGITIDAIPDAANRWLADERNLLSNSRVVIPTIPAFRKYARAVDYRFHRAHMPAGPKPAGLPGRAHDMGKRAYEALGSYRAAMMVTEELLKIAPDDAARRRIRENRIGLNPNDPWPRVEHFDEAIAIVRARLETMPEMAGAAVRAS